MQFQAKNGRVSLVIDFELDSEAVAHLDISPEAGERAYREALNPVIGQFVAMLDALSSTGSLTPVVCGILSGKIAEATLEAIKLIEDVRSGRRNTIEILTMFYAHKAMAEGKLPLKGFPKPPSRDEPEDPF